MELREMLATVAVSLEAERLDVADLLLLGVLTGVWPAFEADVARGLDLEAEHPALVTAGEVRARATEFRYAHGLVSAADFAAWLRDRELTVAEFSGVLARALLRARAGAPSRPRAGQAELAPVVAAEAFGGGVLGSLAAAAVRRLAAAHRVGATGRAPGAADPDRRLAAALADALTREASGLATLGERELTRRLSRLASLDDALGRLRDEVAEPRALRRCLANHGLDWMRLTGEQIILGFEGAALEARLLLAEDRLSVTGVAARAGAEVRERSLYLDEAPAGLVGLFAAAAVDEPVGPWAEHDHWHVLMLRRKDRPSLEDPVLRERAADELLEDALARQTAGRTGRHCVV